MTKRTRIEEEPEQTQLEPFHTRYRPKKLGEVLGQKEVVASIRSNIKSTSPPHTFIFTGPAGTGKTTLARIIAAEMKCSPANITEIDAASNSGLDAMKEVLSGIRYHGFGDLPNRAYIIDECHSLSKAAWQSLLKPTEEPPPHVFFFLCTTEAGKIPDTILTRGPNYFLKPLRFDDLMDLLEFVADEEKLPTPGKILELVARSCNGSARSALVMLAQVQDCEDEEEAARLLETALDNKEVIDLARLLINKSLSWQKLQATLKAMPEMNAESIRIVIVAYISSCLMAAKNEREVTNLLNILNAFSRPFPTTDKLAPLLLAFGDVLYR